MAGQRRRRRRRTGRRSASDPHRTAAKMKFLLICGVLLCLLAATGHFVQTTVRPALVSVGQIRARTMIAAAVNEAVRDQFLADESSALVLEVMTDDYGKPVLVRADAAAMNRLAAALSGRIYTKLENLEAQRQRVPLGAVLGSQIWSQTNFFMNVRVEPIGTAQIAFKTEFEAMGVNQTKYKVYLEVETCARVLAPFSRELFTAQTELLIAETIIVGDVPQTYVRVPEEDVLEMVQ